MGSSKKKKKTEKLYKCSTAMDFVAHDEASKSCPCPTRFLDTCLHLIRRRSPETTSHTVKKSNTWPNILNISTPKIDPRSATNAAFLVPPPDLPVSLAPRHREHEDPAVAGHELRVVLEDPRRGRVAGLDPDPETLFQIVTRELVGLRVRVEHPVADRSRADRPEFGDGDALDLRPLVRRRVVDLAGVERLVPRPATPDRDQKKPLSAAFPRRSAARR